MRRPVVWRRRDTRGEGMSIDTTTQRVLNLGAGNKPINGAVNHDRTRHQPYISVVHDLNVLPWPWLDGAFDRVVAIAVLEHLHIDLLASVGECWRVLAPGGYLHLKLPYWRSDGAWVDPTHYWKFTLGSLDVFDPRTKMGHDYGFYVDRKWRLLKRPRLNPEKTSILAVMQKLPLAVGDA